MSFSHCLWSMGGGLFLCTNSCIYARMYVYLCVISSSCNWCHLQSTCRATCPGVARQFACIISFALCTCQPPIGTCYLLHVYRTYHSFLYRKLFESVIIPIYTASVGIPAPGLLTTRRQCLALSLLSALAVLPCIGCAPMHWLHWLCSHALAALAVLQCIGSAPMHWLCSHALAALAVLP